MAISVNSLTIQGTACPWALGSGTPNTGSAGILVAYNTGYWDGSQANSGSAAQNAAYPYGKNHTHAGETGPAVLSGLTPGQIIYLLYTSGTVASQGAGAGNSGPAGSPTTGLTPLPAGESDNETMPTNVIKGFTGFNGNGTVNTTNVANSIVTSVSGTAFSLAMMYNPVIWINNVAYTILSVQSNTQLTLTSNAGAQSGVNYFYWSAKTSIGGIVGAFTDGSGNVVENFDWAGRNGITPVGAFTLTSVSVGGGATTSFNGTITGGGSNAFAGFWFTITGFVNPQNNGTFFCTASTAGALTVIAAGISETHAGSAQQLSSIRLRVPAGASQLQLGINDTQLFDNTGSFAVSAVVTDAVNFTGGAYPFANYPVGPTVEPAWGKDQAKLSAAGVYMGPVPISQGVPKLFQDWRGQLFPRGAQTRGTSGQNFPY